MAARAVADLIGLDGPFPDVPDPTGRSMTSPGVRGAAIAGWAPAWRYVWPRDASFAVAALTVAGQPARAAAILDFLAGVAPGDGRWQARYLPDGSGRTPDGRGVQADGGGWVCWAVWAHLTARPAPAGPPGADLRRWWPMVAASADAITGRLDSTGQPAPSPDYWETPTDRVTLETVTASLVGLRAAAAVARRVGRAATTAAWSAAAARLTTAAAHRWAPWGYPRSLPGGGVDAAVGLLAGLAPDLPGLPAAVTAAGQVLRLPNGGVRPGQDWPHHDGLAWTPETAMLALGSHTTDPAGSARWLRWLDTHRTADGALPEKVTPAGHPASVAPLGWTAALVLLSLRPALAPPP